MTTRKNDIVEDEYTKKITKYGKPLLHSAMQGAAFTLGGIIVSSLAGKFSTHNQDRLLASDENILPFDRAANS
jgi:hypothetical protein